jgi:hypothetical protein
MQKSVGFCMGRNGQKLLHEVAAVCGFREAPPIEVFCIALSARVYRSMPGRGTGLCGKLLMAKRGRCTLRLGKTIELVFGTGGPPAFYSSVAYPEICAALTPAERSRNPRKLPRLKSRMVVLSNQPVRKPPERERQVVGWGSGGPIYADETAERFRASTVRLALQEIADVQGDVDAFINQYDEQMRKMPKIAASIAQRLLAAGRAEEAWQAIKSTEPRRSGWLDFEWEDARIAVLDALGRGDEAQACRWSCFESALSASHLRAYLKRLPDFDDVEAEERALDHAQGHKSVLQALSFLVSWPALDRAASLVIRRVAELDGDHFDPDTGRGRARWQAPARRYPDAEVDDRFHARPEPLQPVSACCSSLDGVR